MFRKVSGFLSKISNKYRNLEQILFVNPSRTSQRWIVNICTVYTKGQKGELCYFINKIIFAHSYSITSVLKGPSCRIISIWESYNLKVA